MRQIKSRTDDTDVWIIAACNIIIKSSLVLERVLIPCVTFMWTQYAAILDTNILVLYLVMHSPGAISLHYLVGRGRELLKKLIFKIGENE